MLEKYFLEQELKREGKWEEYEKQIHNDEIDNRIKEFKIWMEEKINESNDAFFSENGELEKWVGKIDKEQVKEYTESVIKYLEGLKK